MYFKMKVQVPHDLSLRKSDDLNQLCVSMLCVHIFHSLKLFSFAKVDTYLKVKHTCKDYHRKKKLFSVHSYLIKTFQDFWRNNFTLTSLLIGKLKCIFMIYYCY